MSADPRLSAVVTLGVNVALDVVDEVLRRRGAATLTTEERDAASRRLQAASEARARAVNARFDRLTARRGTPAA